LLLFLTRALIQRSLRWANAVAVGVKTVFGSPILKIFRTGRPERTREKNYWAKNLDLVYLLPAADFLYSRNALTLVITSSKRSKS
jgi:hypothetical protein